MPNPSRLWKVKRSMAGIKVVLGERKRAYLLERKLAERNEKATQEIAEPL